MRITKKQKTDAGVSVVVGFILIFAIMMMALTLYQSNAVPQLEKEAEIAHHRQAVNQLQNFQSEFIQASSGEPVSTTFNPGLTYGSPGSIFVHSPPASGTVSVVDYKGYDDNPGNVIIKNAIGRGPANVFWHSNNNIVGNGEQGFEYDTKYFSFHPQYYHFQSAPNTFLSYGALYKQYPKAGEDNRVLMTNQQIVSGKDINLMMMDGDLTTARASEMTLEVKPVSASDNDITVTNAPGESFEIELPTTLTREKWVEILQGQSCVNDLLANNNNTCDTTGENKHVTGIEWHDEDTDTGTTNDRVVIIKFEEGTEYNLKMSEVFVTSKENSTNPQKTQALYSAWKGDENMTVREDSKMAIPAKTLDQYNNPVGGAEAVAEAVDVNANANSGFQNRCYGGYESAITRPNGETENCTPQYDNGIRQRGIEVSPSEGDVNFIYIAPSVQNDVDIEFRVCLKRYLDNPSFNADTCGDINPGDRGF